MLEKYSVSTIQINNAHPAKNKNKKHTIVPLPFKRQTVNEKMYLYSAGKKLQIIWTRGYLATDRRKEEGEMIH